MWLQLGLFRERGAAEMPHSCSSRRSPSEDVETCAEEVVVVWMSGPVCWWWDDEELFRSSQFRQGGRL